MSYEIKLDIFEGPLDLLLYLVKKNEIDIYNIPIALITEQYLEYINIMKVLNLDLAGEYLLLAATLIHIKSRMLLPDDAEEEGEGEDPREELVRQLLEYQACKEAALNLNALPMLNRDVFTNMPVYEPRNGDSDGFLKEIGIFELVEAFRRVIAETGQEELMEIDRERISLSDRINEIMDILKTERFVNFEQLLSDGGGRVRIIYTFLALLELMKMRLVRARQAVPYGPIRIDLAVEEE